MNVNEFNCEVCGYSSFNKSSISNHIASVHQKKKLSKCGNCEYMTFYQNNLKTHIITVHEG